MDILERGHHLSTYYITLTKNQNKVTKVYQRN